MINEYCVGCLSVELANNLNQDCYRMKDNDDGKCPCVLCILKVMCTNECDPLIEWVKSNAPLKRLDLPL